MPQPNKCPQCGTPLPTGALAGLCPACLLKMGAAADTVTDAKQKAFVPPSVAELAAKFPQLEILELIGKGGMGAVYKARQKQLDRIVALKILPPGIGDEPAFAERFAREAKALAKLNHPNIVTLYEFGDAGGQFYFLMEFVDGVNLRQLLAGSRVSAREALAIVPQICDALQFAHDQGIVHRDIKPENILLDRRGRVKVADFGLAKIVGVGNEPSGGGNPADVSSATEAGKVMGTPNYMSPEQIAAPGEVDHRADIYALGVVFYQMLTGELPGKKIEAPSKKVQIDVRLDEIVLRALEKNPELRYQQVSEVKTCVETIAGTSFAEQMSERTTSRGRFGRIMLVGVRNGERAINWPGVIQTWLVIYGAMLLGVFIAFGRWVPIHDLIASTVGVATFLTAALVQMCRKTPIEKLPPLDVIETDSRFSRTAIVGACLAALALVLFALSYIVDGLEIINPIVDYELVSKALAALGALCLLISTIIGWMSVTQIRRAAGKLRGMWLAVFDGLLFPLLALDFLIWYLCIICTLVFRNGSDGLGRIQFAAVALIVSVIISALVDGLIIRRVWRAVNRPVEGSAPGAPQSKPGTDKDIFRQPFKQVFGPRKKPDQFWRWFAVAVFAFISIPILIAIVGLLAAIAIPNFVKARAQAQANARQAAELVATNHLVAPSLVFGPVMERVIPDSTRELGFALDFETGVLLKPPGNVSLHMLSEGVAFDTNPMSWARKYGGDLVAMPDGGVRFIEGVVSRQANESHLMTWDEFTPERVVADVNRLLTNPMVKMDGAWPQFYTASDRAPLAMAFITRKHSQGVIQILGNSKNPPGVKIRYKLVQNGGAQNLSPMAAVQDWLTLMDVSAFPQSWETAADSFHDAITKNDWIKLSEKVRQPLGQLISRKEISAQQSSALPGMPDGSYFVAQFETSFAALTNAVETVTFGLEKDGQWKAIAYLIRPRTADQTAAVKAAQRWLAGIDDGNYAASWTDASEYFQGAITQDKWVSALESVRQPLGKLEIRTVDSAVTETQLPDAPDGKYVVMQFETAFSKMSAATETVTFSLEADGTWKACGYYIK